MKMNVWILMVGLLAVSVVSADIDMASAITPALASSELIVSDMSLRDANLFNSGLLAITPVRDVFYPDENLQFKIRTDVPCNAKNMNFVIDRVNGGNLYKIPFLESSVTPCQKKIFDFGVMITSTTGDYVAYLEFFDADNRPIYRDEVFFRVGMHNCPENGCTDWADEERILNGVVQTKTCSVYGFEPACLSDRTVSRRIVCDDGFVLTNAATCARLIGFTAETDAETILYVVAGSVLLIAVVLWRRK